MEPIQMKDIICKELDEHKAGQISVLEVEHLTSMADYFVICTAKSTKQVRALAEFVEDKLKEEGISPLHSDGMTDGNWAVLDYGDVIVHVFNGETRIFYGLEKLWSDGTNLHRYPEDSKEN